GGRRRAGRVRRRPLLRPRLGPAPPRALDPPRKDLRPPVLRRLAVLPLLAASLLGLAACGEKDDRVSAPAAQKVRLMLDYLPNADHAGIYEAIADGSVARARRD